MAQRKAGVLAVASLLVVSGGAGAKVELLGQPCRAKNVLASLVVKDPTDGRNWLVLTNMNEDSGAELLFIDYKADKGELFRAPAGAGSWALLPVPGDRLVVGTFYDGTFMVFDLKARKFIKAVKFPGEDYIWNLALGKDGRVYGGTYPGGKLGALDLAAYTVEDCGAPAPPNMYLRYVSPTPDGRIFCQFGMDKTATLIYDPDTKAFTPAPAYLQDVTKGAVWNGYFLYEDRVYAGKDLAPVKERPFPLPAGVSKWSVDTTLTTPEALYLRSGSAIYRYRKGESAPTLVVRADLKGGGFTAASPEGDLLGRRGPDYCYLPAGSKDFTLKPIPVESSPRPTHFLALDPKGRLWGGPSFGQTLFWLDPATKRYANTSVVSNNGGEVYDATFRGNTLYCVAYAGGEIIRYDTDKPFDQFGGVNPRTIATVGPEYIRPEGGVTLGPDGKLYSGWMARYGSYGGALAITDPDTGATEIIKDPLGAQTVSGVDTDGARIYLGTSLGANGLRNKPDESPRFGVLDAATHKEVFRHEFPGAGWVHHLGYDPVTKRAGMVAGDRIAIYDPAAGKMVDVAADAPKVTSPCASVPGDGHIYYGSGTALVALDLATGKAATVAELPASVDRVAAAKDGALYASCGVNLYRVREAGE